MPLFLLYQSDDVSQLFLITCWCCILFFLFQLMLEIQEEGSNTIIMNSTVLSTKLPLPKCGMLIRTITKLQSVANCLIQVLVQNGLFCSLIRKERTILKHCRKRELFY